MSDPYWVVRRGTDRGAGAYYWFHLGEHHEMAQSAWSNRRRDADRFPSWAAAQEEACNAGSTCRPVRVVPRPTSVTTKGTP